MKRIIAIGGGEVRHNETFTIDKEIVSSIQKQRPKVLFIPTASNEPKGYIERIEELYGKRLGCEVNTLYLIEGNTTKELAHKMILDSDLIYVGGGNTKNMLRIWEKYSVNDALREAYERGVVLSGLSAGSICWFESGHSDSDTYENGVESPFIRLKALGLIQGIHCPHYNEEGRSEDFKNMIFSSGEIGIAIENKCAIEFVDDKYRIIKSDEGAKAYKVYKFDDKVIEEELKNTEEYKSIESLLGNY